MTLSSAVQRALVESYGWSEEEAETAVEKSRVCIDGVPWEDLPDLLADLLNAQREAAKDAQK